MLLLAACHGWLLENWMDPFVCVCEHQLNIPPLHRIYFHRLLNLTFGRSIKRDFRPSMQASTHAAMMHYRHLSMIVLSIAVLHYMLITSEEHYSKASARNSKDICFYGVAPQ